MNKNKRKASCLVITTDPVKLPDGIPQSIFEYWGGPLHHHHERIKFPKAMELLGSLRLFNKKWNALLLQHCDDMFRVLLLKIAPDVADETAEGSYHQNFLRVYRQLRSEPANYAAYDEWEGRIHLERYYLYVCIIANTGDVVTTYHGSIVLEDNELSINPRTSSLTSNHGFDKHVEGLGIIVRCKTLPVADTFHVHICLMDMVSRKRFMIDRGSSLEGDWYVDEEGATLTFTKDLVLITKEYVLNFAVSIELETEHLFPTPSYTFEQADTPISFKFKENMHPPDICQALFRLFDI